MNTSITVAVVPDDQRVQHTAELFGIHFYALPNDKYALTEEDSRGISEDCVEYYDCSVGSNWEMLHGAAY